jgi:hypothetical protein
LVDFSAGGLYMVQLKTEIYKKDVFSSNDALYLNYQFDEAKKVIPCFEKISLDQQNELLRTIQGISGYKMRLDDLFGKLIVVLFYNLALYDLIIVGLVGLGDNSIDALIEIAKKLILTQKNKTIILTDISPNLNDLVSISLLSNE